MFSKNLYRLGARRIGILGLPPLGCLPSQRTLRGGPQRNCVQIYNQVSQLFNSKLSAEIDRFGNNNRDAIIVYGDIFTPIIDMINNPQKYGNS